MKEYEVTIGGLPHTVMLNDADAKRLGLAQEKPATKQQATPKNKQAAPKNKADATASDS